MPSVVSATLVPFALAPASVAVAVSCGFLSVLLPRARSRLVLQGACLLEVVALVAWGLSPAARCQPGCAPAEDLLATFVLAAGPILLLVLTLVAAFLIDAGAPEG